MSVVIKYLDLKIQHNKISFIIDAKYPMWAYKQNYHIESAQKDGYQKLMYKLQ